MAPSLNSFACVGSTCLISVWTLILLSDVIGIDIFFYFNHTYGGLQITECNVYFKFKCVMEVSQETLGCSVVCRLLTVSLCQEGSNKSNENSRIYVC